MDDLLSQIEKKYNVGDIQINGNCIWSLFRFRIFQLVNFKYGGIPHRQKSIGIKQYFDLIRLSLYGLEYLLFPKRVDFLVFSASERRKSLNGYMQDRIVEGVMTNYDSLLIENPFPLLKHYKHRDLLNKKVISESIFYLLTFVFSFLSNKKFEGMDILDRIIKSYQIYELPIKSIIRRYVGQKRVARLLIKLYKPKAIIIVYSASSQGYIEVFKENKIPVIELQHGIINEKHVAYNYFVNTNLNMTPDYLLCYGDESLQYFNKRNEFINQRNVFSVGNYLIEKYRERLEKRPLSERSKTITFSGQSPYDRKSIPFLIEVARKLPEWKFIIIPREKDDINLESLTPPTNLYVEYNKDIYMTLSNSMLHCTVNSSCAIDALVLGIPTLFLNFNNYSANYYNKEDYFYFANDTEEFVQIVNDFEPNTYSQLIFEGFSYIQKDFESNLNFFFKNHLKLEVSPRDNPSKK